jgi:hypothetical protein
MFCVFWSNAEGVGVLAWIRFDLEIIPVSQTNCPKRVHLLESIATSTIVQDVDLGRWESIHVAAGKQCRFRETLKLTT